MITRERLEGLRAALGDDVGNDMLTAAIATIKELIDAHDEQANARIDVSTLHRSMQIYRNVEAPCASCHGWGVRTYPNTATWRGGVGGSTITTDVCDRCWGSGDEQRHWQSWRKQEENAQTLLDIVNALLVAGKISGTLPPTRLSLTNAVKDLIDVVGRRE